jgi:hypothetical protein
MLHLRQDLAVYAPASVERFDAAIYGPLYYLVGSRLVDLNKPAYFPLRLLSVIGTVGCALAAGALAFRISGSPLAAALAPLIFLSYGFVSLYGTTSRADSCALVLVYSGVLVVHRFRESSKILFATPLFLLAFFYKQQFVAAPLAAVLFLVLEKRHRLAAAFLGLMTAGVAGLIALFQLVVFRGQDFLLHFFRYNLLPFSWTQLKAGMIVFAVFFLVPFLVSVEFLRAQRELFLACYLPCAVVICLLEMGKEGSETNYFLECIFVFSVLFAAFLARRIAEPARAMELLVLLGVALFTAQFVVAPPPSPTDFDRDRALQDFMRRNFRPQTQALGYYTGDLVRAGLDVPLSDLYQYSQLVRNGTLSDQGLLARLDGRSFGLIVLTFDLAAGTDRRCADRYLTDPIKRSILVNYRPAASLDLPEVEKLHVDDRFYAWVPKSEQEAH